MQETGAASRRAEKIEPRSGPNSQPLYRCSECGSRFATWVSRIFREEGARNRQVNPDVPMSLHFSPKKAKKWESTLFN